MKLIDQLSTLPSFVNPVVAYAMELPQETDTGNNPDYLLLGNDPSVAPLYYKFCMWRGIDSQIAREYAEREGFQIPELILNLLEHFNGLSLLGLSLYGVPKSMLENPSSINRSVRQCLDVRAANINWKNGYTGASNLFHFGSRHYSYNENLGYFIDNSGLIISMLPDGTQVQTWSNLGKFFEAEVEAAIIYERKKS